MSALKPRPDLEVLDGALTADDWATPMLAVQLRAEPVDRIIQARISNPHFNTAYLRNRVTVTIDGQAVFDDMLFAGHGLKVEHRAPARAPVLIEVSSEASLEPDALDNRSRGIWLKLIQKEPEKA
jgi:hypothetical protein